jgi:hypothetical protein
MNNPLKMAPFFFSVLCGLLVFLLWGTHAQAEDCQGSLSITSSTPSVRLWLTGKGFEREAIPPTSFKNLCPGEYTLRAESEGYLTSTQTLNIQKGQVLTLNLRLRRPPLVMTAPKPRKMCPNRVPAYILFGVAGVFLVGGITMIAIAQDSRQQAKDPQLSSTEAASLQETAGTLETVSIISFVGFALAAGGGAAAFFLLEKPCDPPPSTPPTIPTQGHIFSTTTAQKSLLLHPVGL